MIRMLLLAVGILSICFQERTEAQPRILCPVSGSTYNDGYCFKFFSEAKTWNDAQAYCQSLPGGGMLAKFTSYTDFSKFIPSSFGSSTGVWFGANDINIEGLWRWADQTVARLGSLWNINEPNNITDNDDCVELLFSNRKANDKPCDNLQPFVCMQKAGPPVTVISCPLWSEYTYNDGKCFKFISEAKNWNDAQAYCNSLPGGGTLAKFTANTDFSTLIPSSFGSTTGVWFGANDIKTEGLFRWADETPANLGSLWNVNEPNDITNNEDCVEILFSNRKANDKPCDYLQPFVCMQEEKKPFPATAVPTDECPLWPGSTSNDGQCFKFFPELKNWNDAEAYCNSLPGGGTLAKFTVNTDFPNIVPSSFGSTTGVWFGANDIKTEGSFRWADQTPANLGALWNINEPNDITNDEDCVELLFSNRKANDKPCNYLQSFVCMQQPTAKKPSCTAVVDLIYVLDSSGSIGKENYEKQINFTIDLASNFQIGPSSVLVGAVVFSYSAKKYFDLKDYPSIPELRRALSATPYMNYTTHTDEALDLITKTGMFTSAAGARSNSYKTIIVITDGQSDNPIKTQQAAVRLKSQGITINAVGIGAAVDSELQAIASDSKNVFKVNSFDALKQIVTSVTQQACQGGIR